MMSINVGSSFKTKVQRLNVSKGIWRCTLLGIAFTLFAINIRIPPSAGQGRPLPDGPGKEETQKICAQCHELDKSFSVNQDRAGWQRTVDKMVALGAKGTEQEFNAIVDYLVKNFPADEVPKINVNKAEAIEFESGLSLRRSQAAAIIKYREKHGKFKSIADLKKVPGVDAAKIEAKKDRLIFQ
jgi:competence protein ComEA